MGQLMNQILSRENMKMAYKKVKANKGAGGIDGISIEDVNKYLKENWIDIKTKILKRKYKPQPVLRVVIWKQWKTSKKRMWGLRKLGVPEWMARQSVGFKDHYQAVAKTAGLRKITKEILAKRGLISCLDYYLN